VAAGWLTLFQSMKPKKPIALPAVRPVRPAMAHDNANNAANRQPKPGAPATSGPTTHARHHVGRDAQA
jgi:hypothetical protein